MQKTLSSDCGSPRLAHSPPSGAEGGTLLPPPDEQGLDPQPTGPADPHSSGYPIRLHSFGRIRGWTARPTSVGP